MIDFFNRRLSIAVEDNPELGIRKGKANFEAESRKIVALQQGLSSDVVQNVAFGDKIMATHYGKMFAIMDQLTGLGETLKDQIEVGLIL